MHVFWSGAESVQKVELLRADVPLEISWQSCVSVGCSFHINVREGWRGKANEICENKKKWERKVRNTRKSQNYERKEKTEKIPKFAASLENRRKCPIGRKFCESPKFLASYVTNHVPFRSHPNPSANKPFPSSFLLLLALFSQVSSFSFHLPSPPHSPPPSAAKVLVLQTSGQSRPAPGPPQSAPIRPLSTQPFVPRWIVPRCLDSARRSRRGWPNLELSTEWSAAAPPLINACPEFQLPPLLVHLPWQKEKVKDFSK